MTLENDKNTNDSDEHSADLRLVREVLEGRGRAIRQFTDRMGCVPLILEKRNARLGSFFGREDLEDLTQEVLAIVLRKLSDYTGQGSLEGWAYGICTNIIMNVIRTRRRQPVQVDEDPGDGTLDGVIVGDPEPNEHELVDLYLDRLDSLPAHVVRLKVFDEMTFKEIGLRLKIPENSAKTHYYRAMNRLRVMLQSHRNEELR